MSDDYDTQPSLLEYARFHGLANNHIKQDIYSFFPSDLLPFSEHARPELQVPHISSKVPPEPKFRLDSKATALLASSIRPPPAPHWSVALSDHRRLKKLKLEQPILSTDHDHDMKKIHYRKQRKIQALDLVPVKVNEDNDEGLACPKMTGLAAQWDKKLAEEKLQTTREAFKALQGTLRPVYTSEMHEAIVAEALAVTKRPRLESISPPLLPFEADYESYIPSSPALHMQVLSDVSDRDYEQIHKVDEDISNQIRISAENAMPAAADQIERLLQLAEHGPAPDELSTLQAYELPLVKKLPHPKHLRLEAPEVEPLTPPRAHQVPGPISVTLASTPKNLLLEKMEREQPASAETDQPVNDELLVRLADEAAQGVGKDLAEAQLKPVDLIVRVEVPKLDHVKLAAPCTTTSTEFLQIMADQHLKHTTRSFDTAAEREMGWTPVASGFPESPIHESIEPSPLLDGWISQPAFVIKSEDLLWRPDVLRILSNKEVDDDEELEADASLKDEPAQASLPPLKRSAVSDAAESFFDQQPRPLSVPAAEIGTSSFASLARFMDTRKVNKRARLDVDAKPAGTIAESAACSDRRTTSKVHVPATPTESSVMDMNALAAPDIPQITSPRSIIVKSNLLKSHRQLAQALETRPRPSLIIVYRDPANEGDACDGPDIIVTPTTAAIFTTLQASTQRSLPGQGLSCPPIFSRILHLSRLYERLLVITTFAPTDTSRLDSSTTCSQIAILTSFCASHSHSDVVVQAILVPSPPPADHTTTSNTTTPSPLFLWTYALICKHALNPTSLPGGGLTLLAEETLWELFLRKAGMNPFAAQVVLGLLKKPEEATTEQQQRHQHDDLWGLRAFVQMSREERMRMFKALVGKGAVERVSDVLDAPWSGGSGQPM